MLISSVSAAAHQQLTPRVQKNQIWTQSIAMSDVQITTARCQRSTYSTGSDVATYSVSWFIRSALATRPAVRKAWSANSHIFADFFSALRKRFTTALCFRPQTSTTRSASFFSSGITSYSLGWRFIAASSHSCARSRSVTPTPSSS